jgi:hypothetical protein
MSTSRLHYVRELTEQLRINGLPEVRVREIVGEVEGHLAATREDPVATFGQPVDYAAQWVRLSPWRWASKIALGAVAALGISAGVKALFADQSWTGGVAIVESDLLRFFVAFCVVGVLPWSVGLRESRLRASRLGESVIPSLWPVKIAAVATMTLIAGVLAWIVDDRANAAALLELPRWVLGALAVAGLCVVPFMGPSPNSAGDAPNAPGSQDSSWRTRARRWLG